MVNIYDVAREADVSRSTVSRVLNGKSEVNEETRRRVMEAVEKLNYSPNASARALALQKTHTIGIVSIALTDRFYSGIIDGICSAADALEYGTLFCINDISKNIKVNYSRNIFGKVDGLIFVGERSVSRRELIRFMDDKYPVVTIENNFDIPGVAAVNIDNKMGAYTAVRHLIQLGHKRIAHIKGRENSFEAEDRLKGYLQALLDYGIEYDESIVKDGDFTFTSAYEKAGELLESGKGITAVFCANDIMAAAFMHAAVERGVRVPDDISVVGFDDIDDSGLIPKGMAELTTIRQPRQEMAEYAVNMIINMCSLKQAPENKIFETKLVVRESTAPPNTTAAVTIISFQK